VVVERWSLIALDPPTYADERLCHALLFLACDPVTKASSRDRSSGGNSRRLPRALSVGYPTQPTRIQAACPFCNTQMITFAAVAALIKARSFTIDGEAVVLGPDGLSRFNDLSRREAARTAILYAFDLSYIVLRAGLKRFGRLIVRKPIPCAPVIRETTHDPHQSANNPRTSGLHPYYRESRARRYECGD